MPRPFRINLAPMVMVLALSAPAQASPIQLLLTSGVTRGSSGTVERDSVFISEDGVTASGTASADQTFGVEFSNSAESTGSVDASTGQLRFSLDGTYTCNAEVCGAGYSASALATVAETFLVSGTGTLTSVMLVEAAWDSPRYNFTSTMSLSSGGNRDGDQVAFTYEPSQNMTGSGVSQLLMTELSFNGALNQAVSAQWRLQGDISATDSEDGQSTTGFMNAANTATFFVFASEGLTFSANDENFLSNAAYPNLDNPAPVPLPAGLPLLLAGLGVFGVMGGRRKRLAAA
ncbi:VPLPA-CTERM sorting domain-containing protein [Jannaschia sp. CCS1]|uniref:VPLPA-CTERM sorting domain-containing protein n=1 Tax=Jannaschia sp. (strain CCS1) TaxID=290400 RepID=UPI000053CD98|nr:VPLPA-CTERM sorting domain-containing protein [Jannaschia sp. CCS1]ABD56260.1 hypothetical protein Jann_3343 [Jannaschia sp. CCS1]